MEIIDNKKCIRITIKYHPPYRHIYTSKCLICLKELTERENAVSLHWECLRKRRTVKEHQELFKNRGLLNKAIKQNADYFDISPKKENEKGGINRRNSSI